MSKQSELRAIIVIGATVTLINHAIKGFSSGQHSLLNKELLVTGVGDEGFNYIIAEPEGRGDLGTRQEEWPTEEHLAKVSPDGFVTEVPLANGGVIGHEYRVVQPRKAGAPVPVPDPETDPSLQKDPEPAANRGAAEEKAAAAEAEEPEQGNKRRTR